MTKRNMLEDHHPELDFLAMNQNLVECQNKGAEPPIIRRRMRSTPQKNYRLPTHPRIIICFTLPAVTSDGIVAGQVANGGTNHLRNNNSAFVGRIPVLDFELDFRDRDAWYGKASPTCHATLFIRFRGGCHFSPRFQSLSGWKA
ncbi:hypothetical protein PAAG_01358 [Paracoccidioides lutzii Pb01]|uniref:Uncharacterized protein n=1 Tax=Paracoccidioides lutzii (strain ATCC MYA-826 / Pb01) TaxID=502779 RepID=C1GS63_PARBA|nr:hypothetical protein PAAG_01358 [Paracoccidioides lutzii Pb01]EEH38896.2 hypothetical protein PAAG_01358 [Paracoccidioides lutzii Pb01]